MEHGQIKWALSVTEEKLLYILQERLDNELQNIVQIDWGKTNPLSPPVGSKSQQGQVPAPIEPREGWRVREGEPTHKHYHLPQ